MEAINQRSEAWFKQREGRFTASEISDLLGVKGLGLTGEGYCFKKACEVVFGYDKENDFQSFDMKRGNELEPLAFESFTRKKQLDFIDVNKASFFPYGEHAGASPDGLVGTDEILEIKCPRPNKFFDLVLNREKAIDKPYYDQMQMQMLCTNSKGCYFYNYVHYNGLVMNCEIYVKRDEERIEFIKQRLDLAIQKKLEYIESIKSNIDKYGI